MNTKLMRLSQFQKMAGLSDRALSWLLVNNKLSCQSDPQQGLLVDMDSVENQTLLEAISQRREQVTGQNERVLMERLGSIVSRHLEQVVERVVRTIGGKG